MFKGFQNNRRSNGFNGFPALNFQMNNEAYGFSGCTFWLDAAYGLNTQINLAAVSLWESRVGGFSFSQATAANQPRLILSEPTYNNYPVVQAYDSGRFMNSNKTFNGITCVFIANYDTLLNLNILFALDNANNVFCGGTVLGPNGFGVRRATTYYSGNTENINPKICVISNFGIMVNGVLELSQTVSRLDFAATQLFGSPNGGLNERFFGKLGELIFFNREFTQDEASQISSRLNSKYAIY
jgi:hypothetical protein